MNYGTNRNGTPRTAAQWQEAVATKVHGWAKDIRSWTGEKAPRWGGPPQWWWVKDDKVQMPIGGSPGSGLTGFRPDKSAASDVLVLAVVQAWPMDWREDWDTALYAFRHADGRTGGEKSYQPGDWSAAALAVVETLAKEKLEAVKPKAKSWQRKAAEKIAAVSISTNNQLGPKAYVSVIEAIVAVQEREKPGIEAPNPTPTLATPKVPEEVANRIAHRVFNAVTASYAYGNSILAGLWPQNIADIVLDELAKENPPCPPTTSPSDST